MVGEQPQTFQFDDKQLIRHKNDETGETRQYRVSELLELLFSLKENEPLLKHILHSYRGWQHDTIQH